MVVVAGGLVAGCGRSHVVARGARGGPDAAVCRGEQYQHGSLLAGTCQAHLAARADARGHCQLGKAPTAGQGRLALRLGDERVSGGKVGSCCVVGLVGSILAEFLPLKIHEKIAFLK